MSYKVKSLLYFSCFLVSITMYYSMDHKIQIASATEKADLSEMDMEPISAIDLAELK